MLKEYNWEIFLSEKLKEEYVEKKTDSDIIDIADNWIHGLGSGLVNEDKR